MLKILHAGVKLMQQKVLKVLRRYRFSFLSYCEKNARGGEKRPPVNGGLTLWLPRNKSPLPICMFNSRSKHNVHVITGQGGMPRVKIWWHSTIPTSGREELADSTNPASIVGHPICKMRRCRYLPRAGRQTVAGRIWTAGRSLPAPCSNVIHTTSLTVSCQRTWAPVT